jgi:putative flippase GtrA
MGGFLLLLHGQLSNPVSANILGKLAAGIFAFFCHKHFTFRVGCGSTSSQATRYFTLLALNIPLSSSILALELAWVNDATVAKIIADIVCLALTYLISKYFVFNKVNAEAARKTEKVGV